MPATTNPADIKFGDFSYLAVKSDERGRIFVIRQNWFSRELMLPPYVYDPADRSLHEITLSEWNAVTSEPRTSRRAGIGDFANSHFEREEGALYFDGVRVQPCEPCLRAAQTHELAGIVAVITHPWGIHPDIFDWAPYCLEVYTAENATRVGPSVMLPFEGSNREFQLCVTPDGRWAVTAIDSGHELCFVELPEHPGGRPSPVVSKLPLYMAEAWHDASFRIQLKTDPAGHILLAGKALYHDDSDTSVVYRFDPVSRALSQATADEWNVVAGPARFADGTYHLKPGFHQSAWKRLMFLDFRWYTCEPWYVCHQYYDEQGPCVVVTSREKTESSLIFSSGQLMSGPYCLQVYSADGRELTESTRLPFADNVHGVQMCIAPGAKLAVCATYDLHQLCFVPLPER